MNTLLTLVTSLRRAARWLGQTIHRLTHWASTATRTATDRLVDRWHSDGVYRRTLNAAVSALTATLLPHPAVAAALGAWVSDRTTRHLHHGDDPNEDDEDDDDYPSTGPAFRPPSPFGQRHHLWDALD